MCSIERTNFQNEVQKLAELHEQKLQQYIDDSETKHRMEMDEIDERKTNHIMKLIQEHETSITEMRDYYNDITQNNLQLIASLKGQLEELRIELMNSGRQLTQVRMAARSKVAHSHESIGSLLNSQITVENRKLTKPLHDAQNELIELRKKLEHFAKERSALSRTKSMFMRADRELNATKWESEALRMRCDELTSERNQLQEKFEETMLEVQQKSGLKNVLLERKLTQLQKEYERLETVFSEVLKTTGLEPQELCVKIENYLREKNERIDKLEYELARTSKAYTELVRRYEIAIDKFGVPRESFRRIRTDVK